METHPIGAPSHRALRVALADHPIDPHDRFLYHKTTHRAVYNTACAAAPEADDVLLWNPHGEITESARANVVIRLDGQLLTPPVRCGLLAGVYRAHLLSTGRIREAVISKTDLMRAQHIYLVNSVRGWMPAVLG